jgi:hypothetical protein
VSVRRDVAEITPRRAMMILNNFGKIYVTNPDGELSVFKCGSEKKYFFKKVIAEAW